MSDSDGVQYIRPALPRAAYPWQRARGSGLMYEDILKRRRDTLREEDLASSEILLKEWHALIAELDAVMRLTHGYVEMIKAGGRSVPGVAGSKPKASAGRRPRSNSFFGSSRSKRLSAPTLLLRNSSPLCLSSPRVHLGY